MVLLRCVLCCSPVVRSLPRRCAGSIGCCMGATLVGKSVAYKTPSSRNGSTRSTQQHKRAPYNEPHEHRANDSSERRVLYYCAHTHTHTESSGVVRCVRASLERATEVRQLIHTHTHAQVEMFARSYTTFIITSTCVCVRLGMGMRTGPF